MDDQNLTDNREPEDAVAPPPLRFVTIADVLHLDLHLRAQAISDPAPSPLD